MQIVLYANTHRITSRVAAIHMPELYANLLSVDRVAADWMWKQAGQGICYGHQLPGWIWQICQAGLGRYFLPILCLIGPFWVLGQPFQIVKCCFSSIEPVRMGHNSNSQLSENIGDKRQSKVMLLKDQLEAYYKYRFSGSLQTSWIRISRDGACQGLTKV